MNNHTKRSKRRGRTTLDLSDLPENAVNEILCRIPIKEAVRTSMLSKSWRHRWRTIPELDVSELYPSLITRIIQLHSAPIRLFNARENKTPEEIETETQSETEKFSIHDWLKSLSRLSESTLHTLILSFEASLDINTVELELGIVNRYFPNLTRLNLAYCELSMSPICFSKFLNLRILHLCDAVMDDGSSWLLSELISSCPLLETLIVENILGYYMQSPEVDGPNLRLLKLSGVFVNYVIVKSAPLLERAAFSCTMLEDDDYVGHRHDEDDDYDFNVYKVFKGMTSIKRLMLDHDILTYIGKTGIPKRVHISFIHLRIVSLHADLRNLTVVQVMLCLFRISPNLQELKIKPWKFPRDVLAIGHDFWKAQEHAILFAKLETVKMALIFCNERELDFIRFILAKARVLKTLTINFNEKVKKESILTKVTKLLAFPRVSSQAQILLTK